MHMRLIRALVIIAALAAVWNPGAAFAASTAFTYQGELTNIGVPDATYDLEVVVFADPNGITQVAGPYFFNDVVLDNGRFLLTIDPGSAVFVGPDRWLELHVRRGSETGAYTLLLPRQQLFATPYSQHAEDANFAASVSDGSVTTAKVANSAVTAAKVDSTQVQLRIGSACGAGMAMTAVNANGSPVCTAFGDITDVIAGSGLSGGATSGSASLAVDPTLVQSRVGGTCAAGSAIRVVNQNGTVSCETIPNSVANYWSTNGNGGTNPATNFLGTTDAQALEIRTNNTRSLRLEASTILFSGTPITANVIAGSSANGVTAGVRGATIAGGGVPTGTSDPDFTQENPNLVTDHYGTVGGGYANTAGNSNVTLTDSAFATVGGGAINLASANYATVAGGDRNKATGLDSTVGGGHSNQAGALYSTIAGGSQNFAVASNNPTGYSTVGGGTFNNADAEYATIGGGNSNIAEGSTSTIGGGNGNTSAGPYGTVGGGHVNSATGDSSVVGGGYNSTAGGLASTVAGGNTNTASGADSTVAGGYTNIASALFSTVGGGNSNTASTSNIGGSTVAGGEFNTASADDSAVGGGIHNLASGGQSAIGGGIYNSATGGIATIAGGSNNVASGNYSAVGGGFNNKAIGYSSMSPGGTSNCVGGDYSFAGGYHAAVRPHTDPDPGSPSNPCSGLSSYAGSTAGDYGTFLWADNSSNNYFVSGGPNQFAARATGGVYFISAISPFVTGVTLAPGAGAWSSLSDRNGKTDIEAIDALDVLARVLALPVYTWRYKTQESGIRHMGPTAQDFHAAFGLNGDDDKSISTVDPDGVALAAIQGLHAHFDARVEKLEAENAASAQRADRLEAENVALHAELAAITQRLRALESPESQR